MPIVYSNPFESGDTMLFRFFRNLSMSPDARAYSIARNKRSPSSYASRHLTCVVCSRFLTGFIVDFPNSCAVLFESKSKLRIQQARGLLQQPANRL